MLRNLNSLLAALAFTATTTAAFAEEPTKTYPDCGREPTDAEVAAAKGAFQAGNASFNEADYARAIDYWEDAYRRDCTANPLLLNLARAYELAGRKRQAVVSLETFLAREPNSGEKEQITRRIEVLKKKIAEEDAAVAAAPSPPSTGGAAAPTPGAGQATPVTASTEEAKRSPGPWIVIGVGGAAAIVGAIGILDNKKKVDDADAQCGGNRNLCSYDVAKRGNDARTALNTFAVVAGAGGALIAGGVVWYILDGKRVDRANEAYMRRPLRARWSPLVGPGLAGLHVSGAF
jgi:tetratricopeptide (TPR) repeat protein